VTPEEARKLVGGYATGSLTESERKLLYEAALEDQTLFDELAHEHELKELFEEPGARDRLIAALAPARRRQRWLLIWSGAAIAAAAIAIVSVFVVRAPKPVEIAQTPVAMPTPAAPPAVEPPKPAPAEPKELPTELKKKVAPLPEAKEAPAASAPAPAPAPQPAQEQVQVQAQTGFIPAPGGGGRGGAVGGARQPAARALTMSPVMPRRLGFDYTVERDALVLRFATDGWLSLHFAPGDDTIALAQVTAGQVRREPIPNNATEAAIVFAVEAQTDPTLGVNLTRSDKSGTVEDPSGNRIEFLLKFY